MAKSRAVERIRFLSAQIYETGGPHRGPSFPEGFVLDSGDVRTVLGNESLSDETVSAFLRRWLHRGVAESVGGDVEPSDLGEITIAGQIAVDTGFRPFGTARHGRPAEGIDTGGIDAPDLQAMTREQLDAHAMAALQLDTTAAKTKAEAIALIESASAPAGQP